MEKEKSLVLASGWWVQTANASLATTSFSKEVWPSDFWTENEIVNNTNNACNFVFANLRLGSSEKDEETYRKLGIHCRAFGGGILLTSTY